MQDAVATLTPPQIHALPRQVFVRQQEMPPRHLFASHTHPWHQLLYATSGTLVASLKDQRLFVPSGSAVWLPAGVEHSTYTEFGAELKSLYIDSAFDTLENRRPLVLSVSPLMRELILTAANFDTEYPVHGYENDLVQVLLQTLERLPQRGHTLPWPSEPRLADLCNALFANPSHRPVLNEAAQALAMSARTLERHFRQQTGITLQAWYSRMRLMKAIEMLSTPMSVTQIALELGYSAPAPFIQMFREKMGVSPNQYRSSGPLG
ncbi:helix-turn-helix domain-containing protein [Marinobacterium stanieri]|uniref:AraC family transcriptional regulator n=1 Tax=Marinobacterium stanieri TaxID=49186 RepID=UPI003A8F56F8